MSCIYHPQLHVVEELFWAGLAASEEPTHLLHLPIAEDLFRGVGQPQKTAALISPHPPSSVL